MTETTTIDYFINSRNNNILEASFEFYFKEMMNIKYITLKILTNIINIQQKEYWAKHRPLRDTGINNGWIGFGTI
jgi:hypothetical protein